MGCRSLVVYLAFSTSNHNSAASSIFFLVLYILRFLHQTTTRILQVENIPGCISCVFYIKPQLARCLDNRDCSCISCVFYIKPQLLLVILNGKHVVYLAFSTSNHNCLCRKVFSHGVVYLAFSTSNHNK